MKNMLALFICVLIQQPKRNIWALILESTERTKHKERGQERKTIKLQ